MSDSDISKDNYIRGRMVGVYDSEGAVLEAIQHSFGSDLVVAFPFRSQTSGSEEQYLVDKEFFFGVATDAVVIVDSLEAISVAVTALRRLVDGRLQSLLIGGRFGLDTVISMGLPEERHELALLQRSGKFVSKMGIGPAKIEEHLREQLSSN